MFFFQPDEERAVYSELENDVTLVDFGPLRFGVGLTLETFAGTGREGAGLVPEVHGLHWHLRGSVGVDYRNLFVSLLADHERYQSVGSADSGSHFISDLKLRLSNSRDIRLEDHAVFMPAGYIPLYSVSIGLYRPSLSSLQRGHLFDWSVHWELDSPFLSAHRIIYGILWHSDLYFLQDGSRSTRQSLELYGSHHTGVGDIVLYLRHYLVDTQVILPNNGETCLGLRFAW